MCQTAQPVWDGLWVIELTWGSVAQAWALAGQPQSWKKPCLVWVQQPLQQVGVERVQRLWELAIWTQGLAAPRARAADHWHTPATTQPHPWRTTNVDHAYSALLCRAEFYLFQVIFCA